MKPKTLFVFFVCVLLVVGCKQSPDTKQVEVENIQISFDEKFEVEKEELEKQVLALTKANKLLTDSIEWLQWKSDSCEYQAKILKPTYWCDEYAMGELQELGFKNPQKEILDDLDNNTNLLAGEGILGGTMRIDAAILIGTNWVVALASDGHIAVYYLLEYTGRKEKGIKWKILNKKDYFD